MNEPERHLGFTEKPPVFPTGSSTTREVRFTLTADDVYAAIKRIPIITREKPNPDNPPPAMPNWMAWLLGFGIVFVALLFQVNLKELIRFVLQFLGAFLGFLVAMIVLLAAVRSRMSRRAIEHLYNGRGGKLMRLDRTVGISPEGVRAVTQYSDSFMRWEGFDEVVKTDEHLFLYETFNDVVIIPQSAFPNVAMYDEFAELASRYHSSRYSRSHHDRTSP